MGSRSKEKMHASIVKGLLDVFVLSLIKGGPLCGNEITKGVKKQFGVFVSPSAVYSLMNSLRAKDFVCYHGKDANKKTFILTEEGEEFRKRQMRAYLNFNEFVVSWLKQ